MQGLEAGQAEARASVKAMQAEKAEVEGRLHALEDKLEALEQENASLESMKVGRTQTLCVGSGDAQCMATSHIVPHVIHQLF